MKRRHQLTEETTFFRLTPDVRNRLIEINLTAAEWRMWCYLVSLDPFGDRGAKFIPAELMLKCRVKKSTYFAAKAKFQKFGLFDFQDGVTKVVNLQTSLDKSHSEISDSHSEISDSHSEISDSHSEISDSHSEISDSQSLKCTQDKSSGSPQTIQIDQIDQISLSDPQQHEKNQTDYKNQEREREFFLKNKEEEFTKEKDNSTEANEQRFVSQNISSSLAKETASTKRTKPNGFGKKKQAGGACSTNENKASHKINEPGAYRATCYEMFLEDVPENIRDGFLRFVQEKLRAYRDPIIEPPVFLGTKVQGNQRRCEAWFEEFQQKQQDARNRSTASANAAAERQTRKEMFYKALEEYLNENGLEHNYQNEMYFTTNIWAKRTDR